MAGAGKQARERERKRPAMNRPKPEVRHWWMRAAMNFIEREGLPVQPGVSQFYELAKSKKSVPPLTESTMKRYLVSPEAKDTVMLGEVREFNERLRGKPNPRAESVRRRHEELTERLVAFLKREKPESIGRGLYNFVKLQYKAGKRPPSDKIMRTLLNPATHASNPELQERVRRVVDEVHARRRGKW
ncbi:MAG TPA: hypothetical protein VJA40_06005 [archaeon]|nr:hypothetical protein [archaeon]